MRLQRSILENIQKTSKCWSWCWTWNSLASFSSSESSSEKLWLVEFINVVCLMFTWDAGMIVTSWWGLMRHSPGQVEHILCEYYRHSIESTCSGRNIDIIDREWPLLDYTLSVRGCPSVDYVLSVRAWGKYFTQNYQKFTILCKIFPVCALALH